ncbi:uncharacterized MFS-type transporter C09D4.1-like isoform X2 [Thrips palmi]|uniref:Uncharacterized MFS-type transporter C09D4.1-like isoform X1 n=1 Tax=Thrips palmi TaxID=161013 RepID=A0A6P9AD94_THRPL|nr:uncharacterized MFS-type transporter C09D4.1-like isoform X1 [Thrips palmi]XP_034256208.1 uncharacterized MFS-type transporter C09D4.1-like isoform X2 [Thrips palmi]
MGTAIDVIWKSWDNFDGGAEAAPGGGGGVDAALLAKTRLSPYAPRSPFHPRRPSTTLWDLKDARSSLTAPRAPRSPLASGLGAAAAAAAAGLASGAEQAEHTGIKVYKRRWLMLAIFVFLGITNTFQWVQYSIITNIVERYYSVSSFYVDLTSMSYLIAYMLCFIPASWFLDKHGLRWALIVAAGLTSLGSWVKVGSVGRDRFWVTMTGQVVVAVGQVFMLFLPPRLASVWFGPDQVSLACSLGFIGILIGNAAGLWIPPLLVPNSEDLTQVGADLRSMFLGMAACTTASLVLQLALFQEEPPLPPSPAQQLQRDREDDGQTDEFWTSLRRLLADKQFMLLLLSWSLNVGVYCAINTLLSQLVLPHHPNSEKEIGVVGLVMILSGIVGALLCGVFLDRTHKFKPCTMALYVLSLVGWAAFTFLLPSGKMHWVYLTAVVYGFAMTAVQPVGLEFGAEVTFPEPEGTTAALMCSVVQLSGVVLIFVGGHIKNRAGVMWTMVFLTVPLFVSCVILLFVKPELKRQAAQHAPRRLSRLMSI